MKFFLLLELAMQPANSCHESDDEKFFDCVEKSELPTSVSSNDESVLDNVEKSNAFDPNLQEELAGVEKEEVTDLKKEELTNIEKQELTDLEKEELLKDALKIKEEGNELFKKQLYIEAENTYTEGLRICPECYSKDRSILFSNRSASLTYQNKKEEAIADCSEALKLNPSYLKALLRRASLYEECEKLDEAFEDYKKVLELDPSNQRARASVAKLPAQIEARNEKMKEEMIGTLKDLGNKVLGKFGLSTDNFQLQQNPETGSYNIQFNQKP